MAKKSAKIKEFDVLFERDESGYVVATVPALPGCHTQGKSMHDAQERVKEAISLYLEVLSVKSPKSKQPKFMGVRKIGVPLPS